MLQTVTEVYNSVMEFNFRWACSNTRERAIQVAFRQPAYSFGEGRLPQGMEDANGAREDFKAKRPQEGRTRIGCRRTVVGDGRWSIRINCWVGGGCVGAGHRNASRTLPR